MLTSYMRRALRLLSPTPLQKPVPICVPEWSEPMAEQHAAIWWKVKPYTRTSVERVVALCQSIAYLENHQVPGDIVECGGSKGGSMMASALALLALDSTQRQLYLYGTFTKEALMQTRYPWEKLIFVPSLVGMTLPDEIALIQIDTDHYESTYHQLEHLYPRLVEGGVLIVDAQKAVDDYFRNNGIEADLRTIDNNGRLLVKQQRHALSLAA